MTDLIFQILENIYISIPHVLLTILYWHFSIKRQELHPPSSLEAGQTFVTAPTNRMPQKWYCLISQGYAINGDMAYASLSLRTFAFGALSHYVRILTTLKPLCWRDLIEKEKGHLGTPAVPVPSLLSLPRPVMWMKADRWPQTQLSDCNFIKDPKSELPS